MGLEPTTSTLQRSHSSQLSYAPVGDGSSPARRPRLPAGPSRPVPVAASPADTDPVPVATVTPPP